MARRVNAKEFREHLGIAIAPFVPLEDRPTYAFHPSALSALENPNELETLNGILRKEWQARCDAVDSTLPLLAYRGFREALAGVKKTWKNKESEIEMLSLDVEKYNTTGLRIYVEAKAKSSGLPKLYLDGFDAEVEGKSISASLAVAKTGIGHSVEFRRIDHSKYMDRSQIRGTHPYFWDPIEKEEARKKLAATAFPSAAGRSGATLGALMNAFFVELYFFSTGMQESQAKEIQPANSKLCARKTDSSQSTPVALGHAEASSSKAAKDMEKRHQDVWESFDTQTGNLFERVGEPGLQQAYAHVFGQPIEEAPSWYGAGGFGALAAARNAENVSRVTLTSVWKKGIHLSPAKKGNRPTKHSPATQHESLDLLNSRQTSTSAVYSETDLPTSRTYSHMLSRTDAALQETSRGWKPLRVLTKEDRESPEFLEACKILAAWKARRNASQEDAMI